MHTPVAVTQKALAFARELKADCLVGIGGGSTTGLAKALALRTGLPQIVVPTTYAGSEVTPILGETENGEKITHRDDTMLPDIVIYDPELTLTLPLAVSVTSGINAIAHAAEALYSAEANPVIDQFAKNGMAAVARALPRLHAAPGDMAARSDALYGAWMCGTCLGAVGMALHHKLCHVLGGAFDLPHAPTHTVILPHALAYNRNAAPRAMTGIANALGGKDGPEAVYELAARLNAPLSLESLGFAHSDIERAVELALARPYPNPKPLDAERLSVLLTNAWRGNPPARD
jgi:maleylacetate reductase